MMAFRGMVWGILLSLPLWVLIFVLAGCQTTPRPIPSEVVMDVSFRLHVCPDHQFFPVANRRLEVGGCASPGEVWIKGMVGEGGIMPESMSVLGHEIWHVVRFGNTQIANPDTETNEK